MPKKVIVAMSGGVDSSVAAALLKKQGFQVMGVFMKLNNISGEALSRAKKVAQTLKIPFYVLDFRREFRQKVINFFIREYRAGRTPNPCVICNKEIKFGLLRGELLSSGADCIATGHYVRLVRHRMSKRSNRLLMAKDKNKDQSYFLWRLNRRQLSRVLFPVGGYTKSEVRRLAKKFKLPAAETPESQEICFVPNTTNEFLQRYFKPKKGKIVDVSGKILGEHQGLAFYTIGQRRGIMVPQGPYWVKDRDFKKNILVVTKNEKDLLKKELFFREANWLSPKESAKADPAGQAGKIQAKIRYRAKLASGKLVKPNKFVFDKPQRAVTPGQSVVFYKRQELIGGGIIC